jgi:Xaa-Pro aminopeptidase
MKNRLARLRRELQLKGMEAALVTKRENIRYLSGFTGTYATLVITEGMNAVITDSRYTEQAKEQSPGWDIVRSKTNADDAVAGAIWDSGAGNLGFEDASMPYAYYERLKKRLNIEMKPMGKIIEGMRIIKDKNEIDMIREAARIADMAFKSVLGILRPGVTERDVAAELEYFIKRNGADDKSFETIVASGSRSALPHWVASEKKIQAGDTITIDFGAVYKGYCSDMTRTVFLGNPGEEMRKVYGIVLDAQKKALENVFEGLTGKEIDGIARDFITKSGYGEYFGHGLGHGVGLEVHEEPRLSPRSDTIMENGMAVTVEPGIYLPGKAGVRIEDLVVINGNKPEILTSSDKALTVL